MSLQTLNRQRLRPVATAPFAFGCPVGLRLWVIRANSRAAPAGRDRFIPVCPVFPGGRRGVFDDRGSSAAHIATFDPRCPTDGKSRVVCRGLSVRNAGLRGPSPHLTHNDGRRAAAVGIPDPSFCVRVHGSVCARSGPVTNRSSPAAAPSSRMTSSFAPSRVTGPGTYSVRCGPRDQYRPRQNPLSHATPLLSPAVPRNRSGGPAASGVGRPGAGEWIPAPSALARDDAQAADHAIEVAEIGRDDQMLSVG